MDGDQPRDNPMPIDNTGSPKRVVVPFARRIDISGGHTMCGGQLNGEPMIIDRVFPIFNDGSFPACALTSTLDIPRLEGQVDAVPISVEEADPDANRM